MVTQEQNCLQVLHLNIEEEEETAMSMKC